MIHRDLQNLIGNAIATHYKADYTHPLVRARFALVCMAIEREPLHCVMLTAFAQNQAKVFKLGATKKRVKNVLLAQERASMALKWLEDFERSTFTKEWERGITK